MRFFKLFSEYHYQEYKGKEKETFISWVVPPSQKALLRSMMKSEHEQRMSLTSKYIDEKALLGTLKSH